MTFKQKLLIQVTYLVVICNIQSSVVTEEQCGKVLVGRPNIIGGMNSVHGAFPWVAVLINEDRYPFGGGTLLTKNKVLSAAHCFQGINYKVLARELKVVLGAHDLNDPFEFGKTTVGVGKIEIHDDWNPSTPTFDADIALVTLVDDVTFNRYIQPICLIGPGSKAATVKQGFVAGYGISNLKTKEQPNILQYTELPIQKSNEECFYTKPSLVNLSSNRTFCAGNRDGSGVCAGDSGNGLFVVYDDIYYIRGIVSASFFTPEGCDVNNYAIYTNVLKFRDWIKNKLDSNNAESDISSLRFNLENDQTSEASTTKSLMPSQPHSEVNTPTSTSKYVYDDRIHFVEPTEDILNTNSNKPPIRFNLQPDIYQYRRRKHIKTSDFLQ